MLPKVSFDVSVKGEESGKDYSGLFEVKTKLSLRDQLKEDEIYRNVLGANPQTAGGDAAAIAQALAYLAVRVTASPDWWRLSDNGRDLEDLDVLAAVNNGAVAAVKAERAAHQKKAVAAQGELKAKLAEDSV